MADFWIVYLVFAAIIGFGASARGRSGAGWFFLALLISPLISGILLLLLPRATASASGDEVISPRTHVRCPDCREFVRMDARKCKHCGCNLTPQEVSSEDGSAGTGKAIVITILVVVAVFILGKCTW